MMSQLHLEIADAQHRFKLLSRQLDPMAWTLDGSKGRRRQRAAIREMTTATPDEIDQAWSDYLSALDAVAGSWPTGEAGECHLRALRHAQEREPYRDVAVEINDKIDELDEVIQQWNPHNEQMRERIVEYEMKAMALDAALVSEYLHRDGAAPARLQEISDAVECTLVAAGARREPVKVDSLVQPVRPSPEPMTSCVESATEARGLEL